MNKKTTILLLLLLVFIVPGCFLTKAPNPDWLGTDAKIKVTEVGHDGRDEFCYDFSLTSLQTETFFKKAKEIDARTMDYEYPWLSCYVRGIIENQEGTHKWEIRAGGTGAVYFNNGNVIYLGCENCSDGFK